MRVGSVGRRLDSSLLGANLVVSCAGLQGMKGVPEDDTGSGSKDRYIVPSLRSQLRQTENRARSRFGFLGLCAHVFRVTDSRESH